MHKPDVVVAGCGVVGLSVAWQLARAGRSVLALDPFPGSGASYAAAGMLAPVAEAAYGEEALLALNVRAAARWPSFAEALEETAAQAVGYEQAGTLLVGCDRGDIGHLENLHRFQGELELESSWCSSSACRALEPALSLKINAGVLASLDARVDNRRLLAALAEAAQRSGVELRAGRLEGIVVSDGALRAVRCGGEVIDCGALVVATGHHLEALSGVLPDRLQALPVRPVKGQILRLATRDGDPLLERTIHAYVEGRSLYLVPRGDGRIVLGATVEERGEDQSVTAGGIFGLLRDALTVLPGLDEAELVDAIARLRPGTPDNAPLVGPLEGVRGLVLATGHFRNGLLLAPLTAALVAEVLDAGCLPAFAARFSPNRFSDTASQQSNEAASARGPRRLEDATPTALR